MASKIWQNISSAFKMHGYSLRSDASSHLKDVLMPINEVEREEWLDRILEAIQKQNLTSNIIDLIILHKALNECKNLEEEGGHALTIINAFDVPKFIYNGERKKFVRANEFGLPSATLLGSPNDKADLFCERYKMLYQRTARHKLFTPVIPGLDEVNAKKFQLKNVEYLLGCSTQLQEIIVLGMITQLKESKYFLEDMTGAVQLDLSQTKFHSGIFTENSFVLAEGSYEDGVFHVSACGFPPAEPSATTRAYYGNINIFGGPLSHCGKSSNELLRIENENEEAMFLFLSDTWLDQESVLKRLETLFIGFSECPPTCMVLAGPFCSTPYGPDHQNLVKEGLNNLAKIISRFPRLQKETKFVFVPALNDLGFGRILPRPAIPDLVTEDFTKKVPNAVFTSNPCRIQYCTQEMVIFREDIVKKMSRNALRCPSSDIADKFVKSILSQGHLSPLPLHVSPVYWSYDHALRLYPVPDLIVFCDGMCEPFEVKHIESTCINPGSFACGDFNFKVYYPSNRKVEDSKVET